VATALRRAEGEAVATGAGDAPVAQGPLSATPDLPGRCTLPASRAIDLALARSDEGDVQADLDLAACWRLLAQPYPERVALARALGRGLPDEQAAAAQARLDALGGPPAMTAAPPADPPAGPAANGSVSGTGNRELETEDLPLQPAPPSTGSSGPGTENQELKTENQPLPPASPALAYALGGFALAGLLGGTALGLVALYEGSREEAEVVAGSLDEDLGLAAAVCAGVGIAAGVAALLLWPDAETGPTAGPGDVGLAWEVRF
jgi:hypothetical protein